MGGNFMKNKLILVLKIILLLILLGLVIVSQNTVGREFLFMQFLGLAGIIFLLWNYNREYT